MHVFSYFIDGLLIDSGQPRVEKQFCNALEEVPIDTLLITHHHEDHSGNIEAIKKLKGIEAFASPECCQLMLHPKRVEPARWLTWGQHTRAQLLPIPEDGLIETERYKFQAFPTPGHAIDQISLLEQDEGWLFPGDLYVNDYIKVFMRDEEIGLQIKSLKELIDLDFKWLFCQHNPKLKNGKAHLKNKLQFLEDFYGKVAMVYQEEKGPKAIMRILSLKENSKAKVLSLGQLSMLNMVRSVINDIESHNVI